MNTRGLGTIGLAAVLSMAAALACGGPTEQAQECAAGGSADEGLFAQHFDRMEFSSGGPPTGEGGQVFGPAEDVVVLAATKSETTTRFCVQERGRTSKVMYDQAQTLPAGDNEINLGPFGEQGDYVVRVLLNGALVKNLIFTVS
ncbi:MAG: hypothetical protein HY532_02075 [Chloroflexi bacterium]|nr:hypothetical protein [Chloroflexota bacterium]